MGKDELKACPIHEGECLTHWNIIKHDRDLFQGECRTDCGLVYLTAHKDFYEDAKRSLFSVWNTRPNDAKAMIYQGLRELSWVDNGDKSLAELIDDELSSVGGSFSSQDMIDALYEVCKQSSEEMEMNDE